MVEEVSYVEALAGVACQRSCHQNRCCSPGSIPSSTAPFDFVHLSLQDLRELEQVKPKDFQKLLAPPRPSPRDGGYKWMQFSYTVTAAADPPAAGSPSIELFGKAI
jgi:hypothetical protein